MRAIDTNIVVRLAIHDDEVQWTKADALMAEPFIVLPSVILEAEWVLRSVYKLAKVQIAERLGLLLGNPNARPVSGEATLWSLNRYAEGADFAAALHLALAGEVEATSFATFDASMGKIANPPVKVETLN
jgi:predicted nucleic-acid-binding protein